MTRRPFTRQLARQLAALLALAALPWMASAHGPTRQKVVETITIDAPAATVWARIKDFNALKNWHPAVEDSAASQGNAADSVRMVKLKGRRPVGRDAGSP